MDEFGGIFTQEEEEDEDEDRLPGTWIKEYFLHVCMWYCNIS